MLREILAARPAAHGCRSPGDLVAAAFSSPARAAQRVRQGFRMVSVIPDVAALVGAARGALDRVRRDLDGAL